MIKEIQLRVLPPEAANESKLKQLLSREQAIDEKSIRGIRILKRSIDARQRTVMMNLKVRVFVNEEPDQELFCPNALPRCTRAVQRLS